MQLLAFQFIFTKNDIFMKMLKLLLISLIVIGTSCKKEEVPLAFQHINLNAKQAKLVQSSNRFGFDIFRTSFELIQDKSNMMLSPLSISMALGMTRNGAAQTTLDSMTYALRFEGLTDNEINESYLYLLETFTSLDPEVKLSIANSIWYRNSFAVENTFLTTNQQYFKAAVNPLDFGNPSSINTINNWVSENTNNLIPKIIDQISDDMVMYLINAVYFKGQWKYTFAGANTTSKPFTLSNGSTISAPAMIQEMTVPVFRNESFSIAELPYNRGNFNMSIILPEGDNTAASIVNQLTQENWDLWTQSLVETGVQMQLPKFKFSYDEKEMKQILSAMGMGVAFDASNADFTRINSNGGLFISEVKHKTFIETNEEGTEAAAVTSVGIELTSVGEGPVPFIVDKPFIFLITEKSTGTILFIGAVYNPTEE